MKTIELQNVISLVRENGHLGWIKINNASKVISNASGIYQINPTIYKQKYVNHEKEDEVLIFDNKKLNISKLEKDLKKYIGLSVNFYVGGKSFCGILKNTTTQSIKN